jgi:hypothetical protein
MRFAFPLRGGEGVARLADLPVRWSCRLRARTDTPTSAVASRVIDNPGCPAVFASRAGDCASNRGVV